MRSLVVFRRESAVHSLDLLYKVRQFLVLQPWRRRSLLGSGRSTLGLEWRFLCGRRLKPPVVSCRVLPCSRRMCWCRRDEAMRSRAGRGCPVLDGCRVRVVGHKGGVLIGALVETLGAVIVGVMMQRLPPELAALKGKETPPRRRQFVLLMRMAASVPGSLLMWPHHACSRAEVFGIRLRRLRAVPRHRAAALSLSRRLPRLLACLPALSQLCGKGGERPHCRSAPAAADNEIDR